MQKLVFDLQDFVDQLDFQSLRTFLFAVSNEKIAIATRSHVIISSGNKDTINSNSFNNDSNSIRILLEPQERFGHPSSLKWITDDVICIGFESGDLCCYGDNGYPILEQKFNDSSVQSIKVCHSELPGMGPGLWILYESGYLISIPMQQLLQGQLDGLVKFKLVEESPVHDFVFLPFLYSSSIFEIPDKRISHTVLISGMNAALSVYNIGGPPQFQNIGKLAGYVKERVSTVISKTITSFFFSSSTKAESITDADHTTLTSSLDFEDSKRRILRLSMEPTCGKLVAAADSLGRVTLYDTRLNTIIRIWKGVRDARLAWTQVNQSKHDYKNDDEFLERLGKTNSELLPYSNSIALAIYAPQVGLVSLYAMRHGPCLRCIPVGLQCHIFTAFETAASGQVFPRCYLLKGESNNLVCSVIDPLERDDTDIDRKNIEGGDVSPTKERLINPDEVDDKWESTDIFNEAEAMESFRRFVEIWLKRIKISNKSNHPLLTMDAVEEKLLGILKVVNDPDIFLRCIAIIDVLECNIPNSNSMIIHRTDDDLDFLLMSGPISFSSAFLNAAYKIMIDLGLKFDRKDLENDGTSRIQLLLVYDTLKDLQSATSIPTYGNANDELNDEVLIACRQQNIRAEAFCWTVRDLKKKRLASSDGDVTIKKRALSGNGGSIDGDYLSISERRRFSTGGATSPLFSTPGVVSSPLISPVNSSKKNFTIFRNSPSQLSDTTDTAPWRMSDVDSPVPDSRSSMTSNATPGDEDKVQCSFGMFRCFFKVSYDSNKLVSFSLRLSEVLTLLESRIYHELRVNKPDHFKVDLNHAISWHPQSITADNFCNLMLSPLLGDAFGLHEFTECLKQLGLSGGLCLSNVLLLIFGFFEKQPVQSMVPTLLKKQLSSSPFQRWLRDILLSFQDDYANFTSIGYDGVDSMDEDDDDAKNEKIEMKKLVDLIKSVSESLGLSDDAIPSYDDVVTYCLVSAWQFARQSYNLECMMNISIIVFETLTAVGDQVERRTYGQCTLKETLASWKGLIGQLRVALILTSSSSDIKSVNVGSLHSGGVSIYRFLANDTLSFTLKCDQSVEHESRCQEVFLKISTSSSSSSSAAVSTPTTNVALSAPLLAWGSTADVRWRELFNESESGNKIDSKAIGTDTANQDNAIRKKRPLLLFFPYHNIPLILASYRCWALIEKWCKSPSRIEILSIAVTHAFSLPPILRAIVSEYVCNNMIFPFIRSFLDFEDDNTDLLKQNHLSISMKEFMNIMVDSKQIKDFVRACIELLSFCDPVQVLQLNGPLVCELLEQKNDDVTNDDIEIWPSTNDITLTTISNAFVASQGCSLFSMKAHMALLYSLQLRTQCGLRGIKISEIFGTKTVSMMCIKDSLIKKSTEIINVNDGSNIIEKIRHEFLLLCFRRLPVDDPVFVYKIGELWEINLDNIRLIHITTLIERNSCDDYAEDVMQQVKDIDQLIDKVIILLQKRLGACLAKIDRIQKYGGLIAGMDPEAFKWVRNSYDSNIDNNSIEDINFSFIQSTRHLIIRIQGFLLSIEPENIHRRNEKWNERKNKSDLLLHIITELQRI